MTLNIIDIRTDSWTSVLDFYVDLLKSIQAPDWHGQNVNALVDSIVYGGINGIEPPYIIRFHGIDGIPRQVLDEIEVVELAVAQARLERQVTTGVNVEVSFEFSKGPTKLTND